MYQVNIELSDAEFVVSASSKSEARKKAIARLNHKKASSYIRIQWRNNRKMIDVDELSKS